MQVVRVGARVVRVKPVEHVVQLLVLEQTLQKLGQDEQLEITAL